MQSIDGEGSACNPSLRHSLRRLGVLGGMGPRATTDFLSKLIELTPAQRDQDHIPVVTFSCPQIPDRSDAILRGGASPLPALREGIQFLEQAGAECIAVPCNTAHYWFERMQAATNVQILNIVDAVVAALLKSAPRTEKVALLATEATIRAGIYHAGVRAAGLDLVLPDALEQCKISEVIRLIKTNGAHRLDDSLNDVLASLVRRGATACILACTELPLIRLSTPGGVLIDSTKALAEACAEACTAS